jgi:hypothetical protein
LKKVHYRGESIMVLVERGGYRGDPDKGQIDPAIAHDTYSSWRVADHDDLVLAVALGCCGAAMLKIMIRAPGQHRPNHWLDFPKNTKC